MRFFLSFCLALCLTTGAHRAVAAAPAATPQLMVWVKADYFKELKDGDRVSRWPDASGGGRDLKAEGEARPTFGANAVYGQPGLVFEKNQSLLIPLAGEWSGATIFVVGQKLGNGFWLDSLPERESDLRVLSFVQLAGTQAAIDAAFPALRDSQKAEIATLRVGVGEAGLTLDTFANGQTQGSKTDPNPRFGVGWQPDRSRFGSDNFTGAIAEVLIYKGALSDEQRVRVETYLAAKYGLANAANAPQTPVGFPVVAKTAAKIAPPVQGEPVRAGLKFWMRADDLKDLADGAPIGEIANAIGGAPATSHGRHQPVYLSGAINGRGVVRFNNDNKTPLDEVQWLRLPDSLAGQWPEVTILVAGRKLLDAGVFDSAPNAAQTLRHLGTIQHIGGLALENPFPFFRLKQQGAVTELHDEAQIATVTVGKMGEAGQFMATWADGQKQQRKQSADKRAPLLFQDAHLGTLNLGEVRFDGEIGEVLIYDRALTEAERAQTEKYLAQKWGVPLRTEQEVAKIESARSRWSLTMAQLPNSQSWVTNTFSGREQDGWVQAGIFDVAALPDGRVAAISVWDERHKEIGFYKDGKVMGDGVKLGGGAIASDGKYLYAAMSGYEGLYAGVRRLDLDGTDAPWTALPVADFGSRGQFQAIRLETPKAWSEVSSLAVGKGELYLAVQNLDDVRVYDAATGAFQRTVAVKAPGKLALDKTGKLWVGVADGVMSFGADGAATGAKIPGIVAGGLAVDEQGTLWVAEAGARQQLIGYDVAGAQPRETKTIGAIGGVFAAPRAGQLTEDRILPPRGLAIDAAGDFVVLGNNIVRCYAPDGAVKWTLESTGFTSASDFEPGKDGTVIYTGRERYDFVPGASAGRDWKLAGLTVDERRFPELAAGGVQVLLRQIEGHLLRYTPGTAIVVHRQQANSDIFAPAALVVRPDEGGFDARFARPAAAPATGRFAWSDRNANGLIEAGEFSLPQPDAKRSAPSYSSWIDSHGGIWEPQDREGLRYLPMKEITADGVPIYDLADEKWFEKPREFMQVMRAIYIARSDTLLLSGTTWNNPALGTEWWGTAGREIICYADWSKPTRRVLWRAPFPAGAVNIKAVTVAPAANLLFAGEMESAAVFAYDLRSGKLLGMVEPNQKIVGESGWIDIDQGVRAFTRTSGEVLLLVEESWSQKQIVYRIQPDASGKTP